jgi:hypothetical protein
MRWPAFLAEPLQGKTPLNRVFWLYGIVGSLVYGALEMFLDPGNALVMRLYILGGLVISVYTAVATYRCADNCQSRVWARMARGSAILSLVILPVFAYLELTGALDLAMSNVM